ncbi:MAG: type IX secretion system protein PorQ [Bacteroidales bacterium]|nr:type IX secretion system protein PorQ [Bacteroidales bacterium]
MFILSGSLYSQGVPNTVFASLRLDPSARLASLGTPFSTLLDPNIAVAVSNPSLISPALNNAGMVHYANYFRAFSNVNAAYARTLPRLGTFLASIQYTNFGSVDGFDEFGNYFGRTDMFYDAVLNVGWGRELVDSMFSIGANFKYIFSRGDNFWQHGIAVDVSGSYINHERRLAVSLAFRNIGTVLKRDMISNYERVPFQIDLAFYQRARNAPFAYSIVLSNLQRWNLSGVDLNAGTVDPVTQEVVYPNRLATFADNVMRHVILGGEIFLFRNITFRLSYNYHRRQELRTETRPGFVGFSWGIGTRIHKFQIDYARSAFHLAGAPNFISITANLGDF